MRAPERGDLVWLDFGAPGAPGAPGALGAAAAGGSRGRGGSKGVTVGHEQAGRRPALVVSPGTYNGKVGLAIVCPVTRQAKGYPFEVELPAEGEITGVVLADQVKSLDWRARNAEFAGRAPEGVLREALAKLAVLIGEAG